MNEQQLQDFEGQVRRSIAADLRGIVEQLGNTLNAIYVASAGSTRHKLPPATQDTIRRHLLEVVERLRDGTSYLAIRNKLHAAARQAMAHGAGDIDHEPVSDTLPQDIRWALKDLTRGLREDLRQARRLAARLPLDRYGDSTSVVAALRKAANRADRAATWIIHRAHNEGVRRAIERQAAQGDRVMMLWSVEPNACATCTGYAGALAAVGDPFEPVMEVADASGRLTGPLWGPPAHPNCRCMLLPWYGRQDPLPTDTPMRMRRQAQRAVAAGEVGASEPAKRRAADRLVELADALALPRVVKQRARRRAVRSR
jgi:hypothetical protein